MRGRNARGNRSDATGKFSVRARAATELAVAGSMSKTYSRRVRESEPGVIVVADDDADILDLVALTLERSGHVVHRAREGVQALELVKREQTGSKRCFDLSPANSGSRSRARSRSPRPRRRPRPAC